MKYLKTYENMNLSKNINDLVMRPIIWEQDKQKIINEYENKVRDCFLYLSNNKKNRINEILKDI